MKKNGTDDAEQAKKANSFAFFRAARKKSPRSGIKAENGTDARSKSRGCLQTMPCKKEEKPAKQD